MSVNTVYRVSRKIFLEKNAFALLTEFEKKDITLIITRQRGRRVFARKTLRPFYFIAAKTL